MELTRKNVQASGFKVLDEGAGTFEAIVSVTGNVDDDGEIIRPGAYAKTLKARKPKGVHHHIWHLPIGKTIEARELKPGDRRLQAFLAERSQEIAKRFADNGWGGLYIKGALNLETERGRDAWSDMRFFEEEQEFSIGFRALQTALVEEADKKAPHHWRDLIVIDLFEWSPVLFGANAETVLVGVKSAVKASEIEDATVAWLKAWAEEMGVEAPDVPKLRERASGLLVSFEERGIIDVGGGRKTQEEHMDHCESCDAKEVELLELDGAGYCETCVKAMAEMSDPADPPAPPAPPEPPAPDGGEGDEDEETTEESVALEADALLIEIGLEEAALA